MLSIQNLFPHQREAANLIIKYRKLAIFMKPGRGKTAAALFALHVINPKRTLIVAPPRVCQTVWRQEAIAWKELKDKTFTLLAGSPNKRKSKIYEQTDFHLISYDLLNWLIKQVQINQHYQAVIFDELSMLKGPGTRRFRSIRDQIDLVPTIVGLTGTPTGNSLLGMWSQMYSCVGSDNPLGSTFGSYKLKYFRQGGFENREWLPRPDTFKRIMQDLEGYAFSFHTDKQYCDISFCPIRLGLPKPIQKQYDELKKRFYLEMENGNLWIKNKGALSTKLRQFEAGVVYHKNGQYENLHTLQLDALEDLLEELDGDPIIVVYSFRFQLELLRKRFPDIRSNLNAATIDEWNLGKIKMLVIHPQSEGHGLNLQKGGCNMVFLSVPWSLELWIQTIGRIYRTGQDKAVSIYYFSGFAVEDRVLKRLRKNESIDENTFKTLNHETRNDGLQSVLSISTG